jgi:hypothetical protein
MAQRDGLITRSEQAEATDPSTAKLRELFRLRETVTALGALRDRIGDTLDGRSVPAFSMVLIGPMLWSRFVPAGASLNLDAHTTGPATEDVVIVTDEPVVAALLDGRLTPRDALKLGLARLYGMPANVDHVTALLDRLTPAKTASAAELGIESSPPKP